MHRQLPVGTKCNVPRLPGTLVHRPRLEALLDDARRRQVTLVSAPPGAGKTTLLANWLASGGAGRAAWLTVDRRDNEVRRLAELAVTALVRSGAVPEDLAPPGITGDALLDAAFEWLMQEDTRCTLVLDDVQELFSRAALRTLAHLVKGAPPGLDLVLATRADPPVSLAPLRADGRLGVIRNAELSFSPAEAAELFGTLGVRLGRDDVRALWDRTEGWVAGLRLAACALQEEPDPRRFVASAAATRAAVADYLLKEVLARQDEKAQQFLLRTSIVERLTPDLAAELSGDAAAGERLGALERRGIFLVELDGAGSYRYHALFGALLRARLRQQDPALAEDLHRRAAAWHLANGMPIEAEEHARAAGDWRLVGWLVLERWLDAALVGEHLADDPLAGFSPPIVLGTPGLGLVAAAEACRRGNREHADLYRGSLDERAEGAGPDAAAGEPAGGPAGGGDRAARWRAARWLLDVAYGRAFGDDRRARLAVASLHAERAHDASTPKVRRLAALRRAELDLDSGHNDRARRALEELADEGDPSWLTCEAAALLALLDAACGYVGPAELRVAPVLDNEADVPATASHAAHLASVLCCALRGEPRSAVAALAASGPPTVEALSRPVRLTDRALRAAVSGRAPFLAGLDAATVGHPLAGRALIAVGVLDVVDAEGRPVAVGGVGERALAEGRRRLSGTGVMASRPGGYNGNDPGGAGTTGHGTGGKGTLAVEGWLEAGAVGHPRTVLEALAVAALAAAGRGDDDLAGRRVREAIDLSMTTGIVAPLYDHGAQLLPVLDRQVGDLGPQEGAGLELVDRLRRSGAQGLVDPLTEREREVLHHLPTLMSNVEIAAGMHVSVNTVKTHLKAVYRKLGVDGRRQAVLRGRELELL